MGMVRLLMPSEGRIFMLMDGPISTCICDGMTLPNIWFSIPIPASPESDGSFRIQPLVEAEGAGGPLPVAAAFTLQDDFLAQCVGALFLLQGIDVVGGEVLVYVHAVL